MAEGCQKEEAFRAYVERYQIEVPQNQVDEEIKGMVLEYRHRMQYAALSSGVLQTVTEEEMKEQKKEMEKEAYFTVKSKLVLKELIASRKFSVTRRELEAEALAMARRQNTTVEMIKRFFGEEMELLERDLLERKAMDYAAGLAGK